MCLYRYSQYTYLYVYLKVEKNKVFSQCDYENKKIIMYIVMPIDFCFKGEKE